MFAVLLFHTILKSHTFPNSAKANHYHIQLRRDTCPTARATAAVHIMLGKVSLPACCTEYLPAPQAQARQQGSVPRVYPPMLSHRSLTEASIPWRCVAHSGTCGECDLICQLAMHHCDGLAAPLR